MRSEEELLANPYLARVRENVERLERGQRPLPMPKQDGPAPPPAPKEPRPRAKAEPEPASCTRCSKVALLKAGLCGECFWGGVDTGSLIDQPKEVKRARVVKREREEEPAQDLEQQLRRLEDEVDEQPARASEPAPQPKVMAMGRELTCSECKEKWTYTKKGQAPKVCPGCKAEGGGAVPASRKPAVGPTLARRGAAPSALVNEIAAMQRMAEAIEDLPRDLAIKALRWVLERLEADQVVEAELAEQEADVA